MLHAKDKFYERFGLNWNVSALLVNTVLVVKEELW